jgi:hypothetical protein
LNTEERCTSFEFCRGTRGKTGNWQVAGLLFLENITDLDYLFAALVTVVEYRQVK